MSKIRVAFVDTETTGLLKDLGNLNGHRIIEIAITLEETEDLGKTHLRMFSHNWLINPMRPIDKGAQQVHGMSLIDLKGKPEWSEIAPTIAKVLGYADVLVAHNLAFDLPFLYHHLEEEGLADSLPERAICTMEEGRSVTAMGKLPSLKELCWTFDVEYDDSKAHAAEYDTDVLSQAFWKANHWGLFQLTEDTTHDDTAESSTG